MKTKNEYLEPHTSAWFERLVERNVAQAMHTSAMIRRNGNAKCCTICGDRPHGDYHLIGDKSASCRLCEDCVFIRMNPQGDIKERYVIVQGFGKNIGNEPAIITYNRQADARKAMRLAASDLR